MDALSGVLKSVRLEGAVFLNAEFTAPWCIRGRFGLARARQRLPAADHVVFFHFLVEGCCKIRLVDDVGAIARALDVTAGDVVLLPQDDRYLMGSDLHVAPMDTDNVDDAAAAAEPEFIQMRHGGGGAPTRFVCGYLGCNKNVSRPLMSALPRLLCIPIGDGHAITLLRDLLWVGVRESLAPRPGAESMLAKLAELVFVEALRRYAEGLPPEVTGWLAAMRDAYIGHALALLHEEPSRRWTVDELAREVALSRSALAERFSALVGEPPMQYLTRWRLALAAQALRSGAESIARIASSSGYETEAAFNRAFKREFGTPPAAWRRAGAK
ncbi:MAG TPA: AraC family transcriptional regulator [Burkholderiaceae bacterium]|nr:AraC family transcriptional regulator [Burkholderiaceae bacterium]